VPTLSAAEREARDQAEAEALREMLRDLPHVTVERLGGRLTLGGWTSDVKQRKLLDRLLAGRTDVLDLTTDDSGDPHRLLEIDATIFKVLGLDSQSAGHNFLQRVAVNASVADGALSAFGSFGWMYEALISYEVNIANVSKQRVALLARPHLTTLSGTPATFLAGGDVVFKVAGTTSGDIKPYPFGTTLDVTPTLLRTRGEDGSPRVRLSVQRGTQNHSAAPDPRGGIFERWGRLRQCHGHQRGRPRPRSDLDPHGSQSARATHGEVGRSGPQVHTDHQISLLEQGNQHVGFGHHHPPDARDPAFRDERNRLALTEFVEMRRAYIKASQAPRKTCGVSKNATRTGTNSPPTASGPTCS